jgi:hypothetical protein
MTTLSEYRTKFAIERAVDTAVKSIRSDLEPLLKSSPEHAAGQRLRELEKQRLPALRRGR